MDLTPAVTTWGQDDQTWLGSAHGTSMGRPITLDASKFSSSTHYSNGYLPSGTAVAVVTATGRYGPYTPGASDGTQTFVGFLLTPVKILSGTATPQGALFEHGRVVVANLPFSSGAGAVDSAAKTASAGRIIYV